eukprot:TRINITY_DN8415_c1_g2_i1.p1 TRINITY_DN8415_c1_g2~~TRINITY_DN8415_c1_g2_i1.p1  ORF type:complete len:458 (+),score=128.29 TRINITY_DN8415_c1_g2_i1:49-1422(+)
MGAKQDKDVCAADADQRSERSERPAERQGQPAEACTRRSVAHRDLRSLDGLIWESEQSLLRSLDLSHNKLQDGALGELTAFCNLETLILDHNRLQDVILPPLPRLAFLSVGSNKISCLDSILSVLPARCPQLRALSLLDNPCCPDFEAQAKNPHQYNVYRMYVIAHFPELQTLDMQRVTDTEREGGAELLERIASGDTTLECEMVEGLSRMRSRRFSRKASTASNASPQPQRRDRRRRSHDGSGDEPPLRRKESKRKKGKKKRREDEPAASDTPPSERPPSEQLVAEQPAAEAEMAAEEEPMIGCEPPPATLADASETVSVHSTRVGSAEAEGSTRSEQSIPMPPPLPQVRQLLRSGFDWGVPPPPPPPPPVWSDDGDAAVRRPAGDRWPSDSSESESDAELERVLVKSQSVRADPVPPRPAAHPTLPRAYGPHTPAAPPPPKRIVAAAGWSSDDSG